MPWYKVPLLAYVEADVPEEARSAALGDITAGAKALWSAKQAEQLSDAQVHSHLRMLEIIAQAKADSAAGNMVEDPRLPGIRFTPGAAAALAALEFEDQQREK